MALEEQRQAAIITYVNLVRIKAHETGENKELEYQIKVAKVKLLSFGISHCSKYHLPYMPLYPNHTLILVPRA